MAHINFVVTDTGIKLSLAGRFDIRILGRVVHRSQNMVEFSTAMGTMVMDCSNGFFLTLVGRDEEIPIAWVVDGVMNIDFVVLNSIAISMN